MRPTCSRLCGFTLVELLVVLAILVILAAILFPVLSAARASGYKAACLTNVRQLLQASAMYASDHDRRLVAARLYTGGNSLGTTWCVALQPYIKSEALLVCPADSAPQTVANCDDLPHSYGINYDLTLVSGYGVTNVAWALSAVPRTADLILLFDMKSTAGAMGASYTAQRVSRVEERHRGKAIIGYLDGHAKPQSAKEIDAVRYWSPSAP
jgi:prepilin-type N-terminal cleavage/methylation domain-containing protein/prepilin-type processing-associated H-X9-DG protein